MDAITERPESMRATEHNRRAGRGAFLRTVPRDSKASAVSLGRSSGNPAGDRGWRARETDAQRKLLFMPGNGERFKIDLYRQRESDPRPFVYDSANGR